MSTAIAAIRCAIALCAWCLVLAGCGGSGSAAFSISTNADLASLAVSNATLVPNFAPARTSYTATVVNSVTSVDVSVVTADSNASFTINGGDDTNILLRVGPNTITVNVTAEDGSTTKTYTIVITRTTTVTIDTTTGWDGVEHLAPFGDGSAGLEVYGQTFVVPQDAPILQRLSFWLQHAPNDTSDEDLFFSVVVMQWNVDRATEPVLFESSVQSITSTQTTMTEYIIDTGGLVLEPGRQYVAFLSANNAFWNSTETRVRVGFQNRNVYSGGAAWSLNTDNNPDLVTTRAWNNFFLTADLVVMLTF